MSGRARYLLAVYVVESRDGPPVSSGEVAAVLDRSPAAVTEALGRLDDAGLVDLEPYEGATLTDAGRDAASELHESYVRLSWFFRSVLDLDDHEAEAMELAGAVSPDVAARLTDTLPYDDGDHPDVVGESGQSGDDTREA
jgi:DtxR family Mn-dependent transcriptional regulator